MSKYIDAYDYEAIHEQAGYVIKNRKHLKRSAIERYMKHFDEKCALSKRQAEAAKKVIPGGIQHNLANNHPFPLSMTKAEGAYLYDVDGNRYIDFLCAGGPVILGNNFPAIRDAAVNLIQTDGPLTGLYSDFEREIAELVNKHFPAVEMFRMLASGTEADMVALRLARAYTGKKHIIRILGGYHGWSDQFAYDASDSDIPGGVRHGIPQECFMYTHAVPINDIPALEAAFEKYESLGGVAAFILEAVGQDSGAVPTTKEYHLEAERICRERGSLFVYDEVVTAFRLGMGGAQALFGTKPELTVFGKIIGGGFPCAGGIGGRRDVMDMLAAGISAESTNKVKVGGTLSANPLTALAGITTIRELERLGAHEKLEKTSNYFMNAIAEISEKYEVPAILFNHQSILHVDVGALQHIQYFLDPKDPDFQKQTMDSYINMIEFSMALAAEGLIISVGGKTYLSYDAIPVVDDAIAIYEKVLKEFE